jgi:hypothetical protein
MEQPPDTVKLRDADLRFQELIDRALNGGWTLFDMVDVTDPTSLERVSFAFSKKRRLIVHQLRQDTTRRESRSYTQESIFFGDNMRFLRALFPLETVDRSGPAEYQLMAVSLVLTRSSYRIAWLYKQVFGDDAWIDEAEPFFLES